MSNASQVSQVFKLGSVFAISVLAGFLLSLTVANAFTGAFNATQTTANLSALNDQAATTNTTVANVVAGANTQTLTDATPTPNDPGTPETKASTILTVNAVPASTESITIGTCFVVFETATTTDTNCGDSYASVDQTTLADQNAVGAFLRSLTSVSDAAHGSLTITGSNATATFTTTGVETSATNISFTDATGADITSSNTTGVVAVGATAQISTATPANVEVGDTFTVTINATPIDFVASAGTVANVTAGLTSAINGSSEAGNVTAVDQTTYVEITSDAPGTAFTFSTGTTNRAAVEQENTITISGTVEEGDTFTVTVPVGGTISYVVQNTDTTTDDIADGLEAAIVADGDYASEVYESLGVAGSVITLRSKVAGIAFVQTSDTTNRTAIAQVVDFTPTVPTDGETFRATVNGSNFDYTVVGVQTVPTVTAALASAINGATSSVVCVDTATKFTCTANPAGAPFLFGAQVVDITAPTVVSVTTAHADGYYPAGTVIDFIVNFSEPVDVNTAGGTPTLTLNSGGSAAYFSGDLSAALTFRYTVTGGDNSADLDYTATNSLVLNGGTIVDVAGVPTPNAANLTLPAPGAIAGAHEIVIDTVVPTLTITVADAGLAVGETSLVTFAFSEEVTGFSNADITGIPNGSLDTASTTDNLTWYAVYTPDPVEDTTNVISVDKTGVQDLATNPGSGTQNSNNFMIDTVAPVIGNVTFDPHIGTLAIGDGLIVTVDADQIGYVAGAITINGEGVTNFTDNGDTTYEFIYTVSNGDTDIANNQQIPVSIELIDGFLNSTVFTTAPGSSFAPAIDATTPAVSAPDLDPFSDSGVSCCDNLTNVTELEFTGTAEVGAMVRLYEGALELGSFLASGGTWSILSSTLSEGAHQIGATATDAVGNTSATSSLLSITIDTTPPAVSTPDLDTASDSGISSSDNLTNVDMPTFTGTGDDGEVLLYDTDQSTILGSGIASGGTWSITLTSPLSEGTHTIYADNMDDAGNISALSGGLTIEVDVTAPGLAEVAPVTTPTNNTTPGYTFSSDESGAIAYAGGCSSATTVAGVGNNSITFNALVEGTYGACTVEVTDDADNQSATLSVSSFVIDLTSPTVTLASGVGSLTNVPFSVTATFSENTADFSEIDISVTNATVSSFATSTASTYTFTVNPVADGAVTVDVNAGVAHDTATNPNLASNTIGTTYDNTDPTLTSVSVASDNASTTLAMVGDTITLTFSASESVSTPTVTIAGHSVSVSGSGSGPYTATYTMVSGDTEGIIGFTVDFSDLATNAGTQVSTTTDSTLVVFDKSAPVATVTTSDADSLFNAGTAVTITATFNEPVQNTPVIAIIGADLLASTSMTMIDSTHFTYAYVGGAGEGAVTFLVSGAFDEAGNAQGTDSTGAYLDNAAPVLTVNGANPDAAVASPTLTYVDLGASALDAHDGATTVITTGTVTLLVPGTNTLTYSATDAAGNAASTTRTVTVTSPGNGPVSTGGGGGGGGGGPLFSGTVTPPTPPASQGQVLGEEKYKFTLTLRLGSRGNEVSELQKILIAEGFLKISAPTGYFGTLTQAAVRLYQAKYGIPTTGLVGPLTRAQLNK